jgi:hypothetical protein
VISLAHSKDTVEFCTRAAAVMLTGDAGLERRAICSAGTA